MIYQGILTILNYFFYKKIRSYIANCLDHLLLNIKPHAGVAQDNQPTE